MKIDFEWKMEMEKVEKGKESESDKEGDLLSVVKGKWERRLVSCPPIIKEEVLVETIMLVQLQHWRHQANQKKREKGILVFGNNDTSF